MTDTAAVGLAADVSVRLLGPVELLDRTGAALDAGGGKQRAVFALLAAEAGRVVPLDRLIDELWRDDPPARATASLQAYVSRLRAQLDVAAPGAGRRLLRTRRPGWVLDLPAEAVDSLRFRRLVERAQEHRAAGDTVAARAALQEALELWRGPALSGLDEPFAVRERVRLDELRLAALEERLLCDVELGGAALVVGELERLVADHPHRERSWEALMTALHGCGRQADAVAVVGRAQRALAELGLEPGAALRRAADEVLGRRVPVPAPRDGVMAERLPSPAAAEEPAGIFVGREAQLDALTALLPAVASGRGTAAAVSGDAGIGKTRLVDELERAAAEKGFLVARATCVDGSPAPPYWPWTQLVRELGERLGEQQVASALKQAGPLLAVLGAGPLAPASPSAGPDLARTQLFSGVVDGVAALSRTHPLVLVFDDAQWIDAASAQLLAALASRLPALPVLVVLAHRDVGVSGALAPVLTQAARLPGSVRLPLSGLTAESVTRLIAGAARAPDDAAVAELLARTGGNPYFLEEVLRVARSEHVAPTAVSVPPAVADLVRQRVTRLPEQTATVLSAAAVTGRRFGLPLVCAATGLDPDAALDALEPAVADGLLLETDALGEQLCFAHDLVREALQESQSRGRRARTHARIARHLAVTPGADAAETALHMQLAVPVVGAAEALPHVVAAAELAAATFAYEQADEQLVAALELAASLPAGEARDRELLALHVRLGFLRSMSAGYAAPGAEDQVLAASEVLPRLPVDASTAPAVWQVVNWHTVTGRFAPGLAMLDRLEPGADLSDPDLAIMFRHLRGTALWHLGRAAEARAQLEAGIAAVGDRAPALLPVVNYDPVVGCHAFAAVACWGCGDEAAADAHLTAAHERAERLDDDFTRAFVLFFAGWLGALRRDPAATAVAANAVVDLAMRRGYPQYVAMGTLLGAWAGACTGDPTGTAAAPTVLDAARAAGMRMLEHFFHWLHARAQLELADPEAALAAAERGIQVSEASGEAFALAELHLARADALRALARPGEATEAAVQAAAVAEELGVVPSADRARRWASGH